MNAAVAFASSEGLLELMYDFEQLLVLAATFTLYTSVQRKTRVAVGMSMPHGKNICAVEFSKGT